MRPSFRQAMTWLHTWVGLIVGWILFFIFVTGTLGYFYNPIDRWMRPEQPLAAAIEAPRSAIDLADAYLREEAPDAEFWLVRLPDRKRDLGLRVGWSPTGGRPSEMRDYDVAAHRFREPIPTRETGGGFELYRMHWQLHYLPKLFAVVIVGICTMIMFVTLLTGTIAHKKIFSDFFTFRPRKGQRSWLDFHNMVSVVALPFFVMITFSGLVFYPTLYMPSAVQARYGSAFDRLEADLYPQTRAAERTEAAPARPLHYFLSAARHYWPNRAVSGIFLRLPGDAAATVELYHSGDGMVLRDADERLYFNAVNGRLIRQDSPLRSAPRAIASGLYGLHEGTFAGWTIRWLYFGSGLLGCAMIATGLILWTVKRRARHKPTGFGFRLVECLNIGTIAGLPVGVAAYFWANRLLPFGMAGRADWEMHSLFICWGIMMVWATIRPASRAWSEELSIAGAAFGALPLLNALATDRHLGITVPAGDWGLAGFDLTALAAGLLFGIAAAKVRQKVTGPTIVEHHAPPGAGFPS